MTVNQEVYRDVLNEGYTLHWYEVKSVLGRGAFGVTYLAFDKNLDQLVAIKEYFPNEFSARDTGFTVHPTTGESRELYEWGLDRFIREAQTLAKFKHRNIVRVMSVFELNNTAYMVMEYEQGEELSRLYKKKKNLSEQELLDIFLPILDGLKLVHDAGFIHRDIKPANIYIRDDGSPVLIDFGAARKTVGTPTRAITSLVTHGYAPFEQYNESEEKQGAWTDIYALGACLYYAVNGKLPRDALARGSSLLSSGFDSYEPASVLKLGQYSPGFLLAIDNALMFQAQQRPQDIQVWANMLCGRVDAPPLAMELYQQPNSESEEDVTVMMSTPPSVLPRPSSRPPLSEPPTSPIPPISGVAQLSEKVVTTQGPDTSGSMLKRLVPYWDVKATVLVLVILSILVGVIAIFWGGGSSKNVEKITQQDKSQLASLLADADKARRAGKLLDTEGGAIYLYQQALNIDPKNRDASMRIQDIIELSADGIRSDLAEGFLEKALLNVQLLQTAVTDSTTVSKLVEEVRSAKSSQQDISQLLEQAEADVKADRLIRPQGQNALMRYRRILAIAPDNQEAKQGIESILAHYVSLAKDSLAKDDTVNLERNITDILTVDPDSQDVQKLQDGLQKQQNKVSQRKQKVTQLLDEAQRAFKTGNITSPRNKNALALYRSALKLDAKNATAKSGIQKVEHHLRSQFDKHLSAGNFTSAESVLKNIEKVMPRSWLARDTRTRYERKKPDNRPDIEIISEMIGKFKKSFESRDRKALRNMSKFKPNREQFLTQFYNNYTSFNLKVSTIQYIGHEKKGTANIALLDLVNIQGAKVEPGTWSQFKIEIRRNADGEWKVNW
jgi:serine/threonine protein kinase/tetratricopeptide (TPR) repeat protein